MLVEHLNGGHESTHTNAIIWRIANFFSLVVNGVEFADFVVVTACFKQSPDSFTVTRHLEVRFLDTNLSVSRGEEQIDSLWLVTIVLVIGN